MAVNRSTRRAALGAILAAPLATVPAVAAPSELAAACDWAVRHVNYIDSRADREDWDDDRLDEETDRAHAVFKRALHEPSRSLGDVQAKARLLLQDRENHWFPWLDPALNAEAEANLSDENQMVRTVLREVIALCA